MVYINKKLADHNGFVEHRRVALPGEEEMRQGSKCNYNNREILQKGTENLLTQTIIKITTIIRLNYND
ncbi:hypothetical protein FF38_01756 [Lucilia cuprina]|uniref:Uncharacterized protein n=1 Tax=Lucilia cuprina TaxID=7375 RepID=A0A0L0BSY2_LUCCU|nr:hypothetical protein FF38_01756 [Lucilia cuprina]